MKSIKIGPEARNYFYDLLLTPFLLYSFLAFDCSQHCALKNPTFWPKCHTLWYFTTYFHKSLGVGRVMLHFLFGSGASPTPNYIFCQYLQKDLVVNCVFHILELFIILLDWNPSNIQSTTMISLKNHTTK